MPLKMAVGVIGDARLSKSQRELCLVSSVYCNCVLAYRSGVTCDPQVPSQCQQSRIICVRELWIAVPRAFRGLVQISVHNTPSVCVCVCVCVVMVFCLPLAYQIIKKLIERKQSQIRKVYPGLTCFKEGVRQIPVESIPGISKCLPFGWGKILC